MITLERVIFLIGIELASMKIRIFLPLKIKSIKIKLTKPKKICQRQINGYARAFEK